MTLKNKHHASRPSDQAHRATARPPKYPIRIPDKDLASGLDLFSRIAHAIERGTVLFIRQSTDEQRERNRGSAYYQEEQARFLKPYGLSPEQIAVIDARGESARPGADRPMFEALIRDVLARKVGLVLFASHDRIARDDDSARRLFDALAQTGGILVVGGHFFDPADSGQRLLLDLQAVLAKFENDQRTLRMVTSKCALADKLAFAVNLPVGLVWADPTDHAFRQAMEHAGMAHLLTRIPEHKTRVERGGKQYYVFPYPDADVFRSVQLRLSWLLETRELTGVLRRIESKTSGWPNPGHVPVYPQSSYDPKCPIEWRPTHTHSRDGREDLDRHNLYVWFHSPALFGTYHFESKSLQRMPSAARVLGGFVSEAAAFPGYFGLTEADWPEVKRLLRNESKAWKTGSYNGPRNAALSILRCAVPLPDGRRCGWALHATYKTHGSHSYMGSCGGGKHAGQISGALDDAVLAALEDILSPDAIQQTIAMLRDRSRLETKDVARLQHEIGRLEKTARYAREKMAAAHADQNTSEEAEWDAERRQLGAAIADRRQELAILERTVLGDRVLVEADVREVMALAGDLPNLLQRARRVPGKVAELLAVLLKAVYVRRLGTSAYQINLEFPTGECVPRIFFQERIKVTQPQAAAAYLALAPWLLGEARDADPRGAATAAARLAADFGRRFPPKQRAAEWTAERAWAAALWYAYAPEAVPRAGAHLTIDTVAAKVGVSVARVEEVALRGKLGPARVEGGVLWYRPDESELCAAFPGYARTTVATAQGWPEEETLALVDVRQATGTTWGMLCNAVKRNGPLAKDAAGRSYVRRRDLPARVARLLPTSVSVSEVAAGGAECARFDIAPGDRVVVDAQRRLNEALAQQSDALRELDRAYWLPLSEAKRRYPDVHYSTFKRHGYPIKVSTNRRAGKAWYVWVGPEVLTKLAGPSLRDAIAALQRPELDVNDFVLRVDALQHLQEVLAGRPEAPTMGEWNRLAKRGCILEVSASASGPFGRRRQFAHFPKALRNSRDPEVLASWWRSVADATASASMSSRSVTASRVSAA